MRVGRHGELLPVAQPQLLQSLEQTAVERARACPSCSSRYFDPVTVRAAPRNVRSATQQPTISGLAQSGADRRDLLGLPGAASVEHGALLRRVWLVVLATLPSRWRRRRRGALTVDAIYDPERARRLQRRAADRHHLARRRAATSRRRSARAAGRVAEGGRGVGPHDAAVRRGADGDGARGAARRHARRRRRCSRARAI